MSTKLISNFESFSMLNYKLTKLEAGFGKQLIDEIILSLYSTFTDSAIFIQLTEKLSIKTSTESSKLISDCSSLITIVTLP